MLDAAEIRDNVSEMVVTDGEEVSRLMRDSIAAIGGVRSESDLRSDWYFWTISKEGVEGELRLAALAIAGTG